MTTSEITIREATQVCRQRLQECTSRVPLQTGHWAENRCSDFNLWDSRVGASADEFNCLDKRLEHDVSAQEVVIGALSTLAAWIKKCTELAEAMERVRLPDQHLENSPVPSNEQSTDPSDSITLDEAKNTVEGLLKILVDLEIAVRRNGTASRIRRADRTFEKQKHSYAELSDYLEFILRVSGAPRRHDDSANKLTNEIDVDTTLGQLHGEKAPLRPEQQILVLANMKRAHRFSFYKERQKKLLPEQVQKPSQAVHTQIPLPQTQTQPLNSPIKIVEQAGPSLQPTTQVNATPARSKYSTGTTNQASGFTAGSPLESAITAPSPNVAATTIAFRTDYPKPPKDKTNCPYCFIRFNGEADDMLQWKKHASEDLQPYTCHIPECPQRTPFFNTFNSWKAHVLSNSHQQFDGWTCLLCRFSSTSAEESGFLDHVQYKHSNAIAKESLTKFAQMCRRNVTPALDICPVCTTHEVSWKLQKDSELP